jgi:hypothetical protein
LREHQAATYLKAIDATVVKSGICSTDADCQGRPCGSWCKIISEIDIVRAKIPVPERSIVGHRKSSYSELLACHYFLRQKKIEGGDGCTKIKRRGFALFPEPVKLAFKLGATVRTEVYALSLNPEPAKFAEFQFNVTRLAL